VTAGEALLAVHDLTVRYGNIEALHDVSLRVDEGDVVALIGANGAGKTTTLRAISGLVRPSRGTIRYRGQDLTRPCQGNLPPPAPVPVS